MHDQIKAKGVISNDMSNRIKWVHMMYWLVKHQNLLDVPNPPKYVRDLAENKRVSWRLRNLVHHPVDPNWENGEYMLCHKHFRRKEASKGDFVFDVVEVNRKFRIRSAFMVAGTHRGGSSGRILRFTHYYFQNGTASSAYDVSRYKGRKGHFSRRAKRIQENDARDILEYITNPRRGYRRYLKGERPKSIPKLAWNRMTDRAKSRVC